MRTGLDGLLGAAAFLAGGVLVNGLADLIDRMPLEEMEMDAAAFEVAPQAPVAAAIKVDYCKHCRKPMFVPADRELHVLGSLCSEECEIANAGHYAGDYE